MIGFSECENTTQGCGSAVTRAKATHKDRDREELSSISRTRDVVGDRWTMLILRDASLRGVTRFADFRDGLGIAADVLTLRLGALVEQSVMEKRPYREPGARTRFSYHLTPSGEQLLLVLAALRHGATTTVRPLLGRAFCGRGPRGACDVRRRRRRRCACGGCAVPGGARSAGLSTGPTPRTGVVGARANSRFSPSAGRACEGHGSQRGARGRGHDVVHRRGRTARLRSRWPSATAFR
ncbi:helix-turn-helix domain-containing protein [Streptomyces sp. NPDC046977]|uniref:winged helix-turn-helix transcriptional regulator n=1 Tax=Streptomyces sp. NPDC046977 TaxID=3154703 RepID=UPI0033CDA3E2